MPPTMLGRMLGSVGSIDQFQNEVMGAAVEAVLAKTSDGFTCSGAENLGGGRTKFLAVSNHRDIVMDPALIQYEMKAAGLPFTEVCVGSNLLTGQLTEDLMRSNRMIKVIRGIGARELYLSSMLLSQYIRDAITTGRSSIWVAQREGRTKNGQDLTEQGLLKMFDLSGESTFENNFNALHIVPMSISYEYEPCDARKAKEVYLRSLGPYTKKKDEDLHSILTGIRQPKGHIHLEIDKPLTAEEIEAAAHCDKNDRYRAIRQCLDERIISGYKLWKTNYIAYDLLYGGSRFADKYSIDERDAFIKYKSHKLGKTGLRSNFAAQEELNKIFLGIYAGPLDSLLLHNLYYVK